MPTVRLTHGPSGWARMARRRFSVPPSSRLRSCSTNASSIRASGESANPFSSRSARSRFSVAMRTRSRSSDDLERVRIATENRLRALRDEKGFADSPEARMLEALVEQLRSLEDGGTLNLRRAMRAHPLGPWVKRTVGIGEKQAARLLAAIGDPTTYPERDDENELTGEILPRTVSKLWAYCGFHVIDGKRPRHTRGEQANWSNTAKMR